MTVAPADTVTFLLTPLREGRRCVNHTFTLVATISTHAPAGGATEEARKAPVGRVHFYSRPCGRGDVAV